MGKTLRLLAVTAAAVFAPATAVAHAAPAGAEPTAPEAQRQVVSADQGQVTASRDVVPEEFGTASACPVTSSWGHKGWGLCGSHLMFCPWEEDVVIAPDGTIWHAWPTSGGWKEMPNNGRAEDTWNCYKNGKGQRQIEVVTANANIYYSYYSGGWKGWFYYPGS